MERLFALASPTRWQRFARRGAGQRRLLAEAALDLAWAALLCRLLPFGRAIRSGAVPLGQSGAHGIDPIVRAVAQAAAVMPFRAVCLQQALACQIMLRRRGVEARLHYGVAIGERLEAHVWVA